MFKLEWFYGWYTHSLLGLVIKRQTYFLFIDVTTCGGTKNRVVAMQAIESMVKFSCDKCLRHDVVQTFLNRKWISRIRQWWLLALFLYTVFLISLTTYIGLVRKGKAIWKSKILVMGPFTRYDCCTWLFVQQSWTKLLRESCQIFINPELVYRKPNPLPLFNVVLCRLKHEAMAEPFRSDKACTASNP